MRDFIVSLKTDCVAHNAGVLELPVLYRNWNHWLEPVYCSQIAAGYVDENDRTGLKHLSKRYFKYNQQDYASVTGGKQMNELTAEHVFDYGCDDTIMTAALMNHFITIMQLEHTLDAYFQCEIESMYMIASSFVNGISCNLDKLKELEIEDERKYNEAIGVIHDFLISDGTWPGCSFEPVSK